MAQQWVFNSIGPFTPFYSSLKWSCQRASFHISTLSTSLCPGIKTLNMGIASTRWLLPRQNSDFTWDVSTVMSSNKPGLCCHRVLASCWYPPTYRLHAGIHPPIFFHLVSCCHTSELRSAGKSPDTSSQSSVYFSISILTTFYSTHRSTYEIFD